MKSFKSYMSESLRDWFTKSRSSDGKPGWVQLGGKYAGKSCAKQPGQTTKPKCGSSQMAASMSDKEEDAAARRKRAKDPNPNRSGAPINVATKVNEDACKEKVKARYNIWPSAYASGALVKCRKVGAANWGNKTKKEEREVLSFKSFIAERCWDGYKPNPNKKAYDKGSCVKEDLSVDEQFDLIEDMVQELAEQHGVDAETIWTDFESVDDDELYETAAWRRKEGKNPEGGLNRKGIESYRRENPGSKLSMAVTTPPSKLKPGSKAANRRKSFCARMGGVEGPMKKPNGEPSRKALALRKWNC
jgi:hypothetical protein